jgi:hypothetical protein
VSLLDLRTILGVLNPWLIGLAYGALALLALWFTRSTVRQLAAWLNRARSTETAAAGTRVFYVAALAGMLVSLNTSWNYFGSVLGVVDVVERGVMFFVLELAQVACGWGMRTSIREHGKPGPARLIAWFLCAISAYMAWSLSGVWVGVARVVLGPVLSLVMLHLALGIEIRSLRVKTDSTWVRVTRELRERLLAFLGLSDEERDARTIARQRALLKATRIRMTGDTSERSQRRFIEQLARADVANDPEALESFVNAMKLAANASQVYDLRYPMPFEVSVPGVTSMAPGTDTVAPSGDTDTVALDGVDDTEPMPPVIDTETLTPDTVAPDTDDLTRPVSLAPLGERAQAEVDTILEMINDQGADAITIEIVKARLGLKHSTAARRLRAARDLLAS